MKKIYLIIVSLLTINIAFSQWTKVEQLPSSDIFTVYHKDNVLYAGGRSVIYISRNKGQTWDSTTIPGLSLVNNIIVYKNELFAAAPQSGVFKSSDGGTTWQNISTGLFPDVSDLCEFSGELYASTFGSSVFKLNPATKNNWISFSDGLSSLSANITSIAGSNNALIAGTLANGIYDYLPANSATWEERLLSGRVSPNEGAYDITTGHDTLFYVTQIGKFYTSIDNGLTWNPIGNRLNSLFSPLLNAKQAVLTSAYFFDGANFNTAFFYIKKDSLQNPFINFSIVINHFTYKIDIFNNKLWDASDRGLFYMSLSDLPGITAADSLPLILPVRFTQFDARCENKEVLLTWKTAQEQNSSRFDIEKSGDGIHWSAIGSVTAAGNSSIEKTYSFKDNSPTPNNYYRIAEYDLDGRVQYTNVLQSSCSKTELFTLWPNPSHDAVYININVTTETAATLKLFDSKGALVKIQKTGLFTGINQLRMDLGSLANGIYSLSAEWNNGQAKKALQLIKQ